MAKNAPKKSPAAKSAPAKKSVRNAPAQTAAAPKKKSAVKAKSAGPVKSASQQKPTPSKKSVTQPKAKAEAKTKPKAVEGAKKPKAKAKAADAVVVPVMRNGVKAEPVVLDKFTQLQWKRLLDLRDSLVDAMAGVAQDNLRSRAEGSEASAFGMHQADAGSDAYDRDFALNLLSQEQDALYEIEEALTRVNRGTYGVCEVSGKKIPKARLEAIPYARLTVECQAEFEKENFGMRGARRNVRSIFGLMDNESEVESSDDND